MSSRNSKFDHGQSQYRQSHSGAATRHIVGNVVMEHYGVNPSNYNQWSSGNYRMGSTATNDRDKRIDNAWLGHAFHDAGAADHRQGYDAHFLAHNEGDAKGGAISYQQQRNALGQRFDRCKDAYAATGEHKYLMMQKDLRDIALNQLNGDGREWRLSSKK